MSSAQSWLSPRGRSTAGLGPKLPAIALLILALGLPINGLVEHAVFVVCGGIVLTCRIRTSGLRWMGAVTAAGLAVAAQQMLPVPRIEEGHNAFVVTQPGEALERALPRQVFQFMIEAFDRQYPPEHHCAPTTEGCWRRFGGPDRPYALSGDAVLQRPKYSRIVSAIDWSDPTWWRPGFVNELRYHWYGPEADLRRLAPAEGSWPLAGSARLIMPYFVLYEIPSSLVGSALCWRGDAFWERAEGAFEHRSHATMECRLLQADDAGRRVFGVSIAHDDPLAMRLDPSAAVRLANAASRILPLLAAIGIVILLVAIPASLPVVPIALVAVAAAVAFIVDPTFFGGFRVHDGGDDGLTHEGMGRIILGHLVAGEIGAALRGRESVFYFMPGLRYFRALEKIVFGDTNFGYLTVLLALPLLVWQAARRVLSSGWALALGALFVATPLGWLFGSSFYEYARTAARGYPDTLGYAAFLGALVLVLDHLMQPEQGRRARLICAGLLLAAAIFMRPNLAVGSIVVLGYVALASWRAGRTGRVLALCLGLAPILLIPLHNWIYGHRLVLLTSSAFHPANLQAPPQIYADAVAELLGGGGPALHRVVKHLELWLRGPSGLPVMVPLHIAALAVTLWIAVGSRSNQSVRLMAAVAIAQHAVLPFWQPDGRHAYLAWLLTALVCLAWAEGAALPLIRRRWSAHAKYIPDFPRLRWVRAAATAAEKDDRLAVPDRRNAGKRGGPR